MKIVRDLCFAVFVSPEFLIVAIFLGLYEIRPVWFHLLGVRLSRSPEAIKWVSLAPAGVLVFALSCAKDTFLPKAPKPEILAGWSDFWVLKNRILIGLAYVFGTVCITVGIWIVGFDIGRASLSALYFGALAVNLVATGTLWYASVQIGIRLRRAKF